ncbi:MarR family winged helix-turn-helix transcriptional regulator [Streptomyces melanogenes]|uniref:MarR family winged helix-turn-helix transcriptional regulator n=1 Tax=Streptomyces melanogenes TaxID=67326 RepID=UPI0037B5A57A
MQASMALRREWASAASVVPTTRGNRVTVHGEALGILEQMKRTVRLWNSARQDSISVHGLQHFEFDTLQALVDAGPAGRLSPSQLAEKLVMSPAAITGRLDSLEQSGLLERQRVPGDRRRILVELTPAGRQAWQTVTRDVKRFDEEITGLLESRRA